MSYLGGKSGWYLGQTTLPPSYTDCLENGGASNSWNPMGLCLLHVLNSCSSLEIDSLLSVMEFLHLSGEVVFGIYSIY